MGEPTTVKESGVRVAEAVLIAALSKLFDKALENLKERRQARKGLEQQVAELQAEIAELKAKGVGQ